jgi:glycerophosphoryl diester phosphodiesterase
MICFGHRGARGHEPENTVLSVEKGIALGAEWIEVDVYAVENELIVIHDDRLERTTNGTGYVLDQSLEYLRSLDAGKGQQIPILSEVFEAVDRRAGVNIELKGPATADPVVSFVEAALDMGWSYDQILVSSFNHRELEHARRRDPRLRIGALIVGLPIDDAAFAQRLGAWSVHPSLEFVDARFVDDAHRRGLKVFPFTVNHLEDIARMRSLGIDGVFCDYPERVTSVSAGPPQVREADVPAQ